MQFMILYTLNGLSFSAILFMISIGFSIIIGLMRVVNLSQGAVFVLAAHIGVTIFEKTGSFTIAIICGGLSAAILGAFIEHFLIGQLYGKRFEQVLMTMGIMFIIDDLTLYAWGGYSLQNHPPSMLSGPVSVLGVTFPSYRLVMIFVGIIAAIGMWFLTERTKFGAIVRAGADNSEMTQAMGINVKRVFLLTFSFGALLVGVAGVLASPMFALQPGMSMQFLSLAIVVITVGGMGSLPGVVVGSLFVGLLDSFGKVLFPNFASFTLFVPMALVLVIKPSGLLGRHNWS